VTDCVEALPNVPEKGKQENRKAGIFTIADFLFDETQQAYRCPQGKVLKCSARGQRNRYRIYDVYRARPQDCASCRLRSRCLSGPHTPRRYLSVRVDGQKPNLIDDMKARIDTPQGKQIYAMRLGIVEPVFANMCVHKRMHRFTLRSKSKVDVQWRLFALVHNIGKIHTFGALA